MPKHSTNSPEYNNAGNSGSVQIDLISSEKLILKTWEWGNKASKNKFVWLK